MRSLSWALIAPALLVFAAPASATVVGWTLAGSGFSGDGTFTIDDTNTASNPYVCSLCANGPGYLITAITGSLNGNTITGLANPGAIWFNDNRFYLASSQSAVDWGGIGFGTSAGTFDIFNGDFTGHNSLYILSNRDLNSDTVYARPITGTARLLSGAVPEPATWALMLLGFGAVAMAMRRRRQQVKVSYAF